MCKGAFSRKPLIGLFAIALLLYAPFAALRALYPFRFTDLVEEWARERSLDPALVAALIRAESRFHPRAISSRGAIGLMQITPQTGEWIADQTGVIGFTTDYLLDPGTNIELGTWYLRHLLDRFKNIETALAAYNAGPGTVAGWKDDPEAAYPATTAYVRRVLASVWIYRFYFRLPLLVRITPSIG